METFIRILAYLCLMTLTVPNFAFSNTSLTNGYQVYTTLDSKGLQLKCADIFQLNKNDQFINRVLSSWSSRGDYKPESIERLRKFERSLNPEDVFWFSLNHESRDHWVAIRLFHGMDSQIKNISQKIPLEQKYPEINVSEKFKHVIELGMLDVTKGTEDGIESLFNQVALFIRQNRDFHNSTIIISSRPANARLYKQKLGVQDLIDDRGVNMTTPDGMNIMFISARDFANRFYSNKVYPNIKGEENIWSTYLNDNLNSSVTLISQYADKVSNEVLYLQQTLINGRPSISTDVNIIELKSQWQKEIKELLYLLKLQEFDQFKSLRSDLYRRIRNYQPVRRDGFASFPGMQDLKFFKIAVSRPEIENRPIDFEYEYLHKQKNNGALNFINKSNPFDSKSDHLHSTQALKQPTKIMLFGYTFYDYSQVVDSKD